MVWKDYISVIELNRVRNIPPTKVELRDDSRTNLIITGPNGSGKTTLVKDLYESLNLNLGVFWKFVDEAKSKGIETLEGIMEYCHTANSAYFKSLSSEIPGKVNALPIATDIGLDPVYYLARDNGDCILYNSDAHRRENFAKPSGPHVISEKDRDNQFIQLLVNFKTQQSYLFEDLNNEKEPERRAQLREDYDKYIEWFARLENALAKLFGHDDFKIQYDRENYNFLIAEKGKEPYEFKQLSDGYAAILRIMTDIMLKMSLQPVNGYLKPGIAIIDEIETHLHVELQQKIMPFLIELFPNIQFIVTSHSPFVLSSVENAKILDLSTLRVFDSFSQYSYSNIVEGYFNTSQYSQEIIAEFQRIERIIYQPFLTPAEKKEIKEFDKKVTSSLCQEPVELKRRWLTLKLKNREKLHDIF